MSDNRVQTWAAYLKIHDVHRCGDFRIFLNNTQILCKINFGHFEAFKICNCNYDRPGQPNWESTIWKFEDFSDAWILREINFGHFEAPITTILTI